MNSQENVIESFKAAYPTHELEEQLGLKIFKAVNKGNNPILVVWRGEQKKPFVRFAYFNEENRAKAVDRCLKEAREILERKKAKSEFQPTAKIGDIFASSWGYDQTNVSFYQVIEKPSGKYVVVREVTQETTRPGGCSMSRYVTAIKDEFKTGSEYIRKKVSKLGQQEGIKLCSFEYAYLWDGKEKYSSSYA